MFGIFGHFWYVGTFYLHVNVTPYRHHHHQYDDDDRSIPELYGGL